jgi:hypothetical protein
MFKDDLRVAIFNNSTIVKLENFTSGVSLRLGYLISEAVWLGAIIAIALVFTSYYVASIQLTDPRCGVLSVLDGVGHRPFVYRVLATWILQAMIALGASVADGIFILVGVSLAASTVAFRYLISSFGGYRAISAIISPLLVVAVAALQVSYPYNMLYDMLTLALFVTSYALLMRRNWAWYLVVFATACLSKETSALLTIGFAAVYFRRMAWRNYLTLGFIQFAIWLIVRLVITWEFRNNPGVTMESHIDLHLWAFQRLPIVVAVYCALGMSFLAVVLRGWHQKPVDLRRLFVALAPLMIVLYIVGGNPFELRALYEIVPVALVLCFIPMNKTETTRYARPPLSIFLHG